MGSDSGSRFFAGKAIISRHPGAIDWTEISPENSGWLLKTTAQCESRRNFQPWYVCPYRPRNRFPPFVTSSFHVSTFALTKRKDARFNRRCFTDAAAFVNDHFENAEIRRLRADKTSREVSRLLKRLRLHGLIKETGRTYNYYLTRFGKQLIPSGLKLRELVIIPQLDSEYAQ
jgi:hypothetical protein